MKSGLKIKNRELLKQFIFIYVFSFFIVNVSLLVSYFIGNEDDLGFNELIAFNAFILFGGFIFTFILFPLFFKFIEFIDDII